MNCKTKLYKHRLERITILIPYIILVLICAAALYNFFNFRSLWLDEMFLAVNIDNRSIVDLLDPLDYGQVAPIGFLMAEHIAYKLFGNTDWSLRIYPLLSYFGSAILIYSIIKRQFQSKYLAIVAAIILLMNFKIFYYSIEVKQYMNDILVCLLITLFTLINVKRISPKSLIGFSIITIISIWFSNVAIIVLFTSSLYITIIYFEAKEREEKIFIPIILGFLSFSIYYLFFILDHPSKDRMLNYWSSSHGFLPKNILSVIFWTDLINKILTISSIIFIKSYYWIISSILLLLGLINQKTDKKFVILCLVPIVIHLILSYFKLYPFSIRLSLYLIPYLILLLASGLFYLETKFSKYKFVYTLFILILLVPNVQLLFKNLPLEREEIKKSMNYLNSKVTTEDSIYVYYFSRISFHFYLSDYKDIESNKNYVMGEMLRLDGGKFVDDIKNFGSKSWLIFSHIASDENGLTDSEYAIDILEQNNYKIIEVKHFTGSTLIQVSKI